MRRWWRRDYFLDLGATTTLFAAAGDPAFRSEASVLILRRGLAAPYAAGGAVRHLFGRLPPSFRLARPYRDGRVEDADLRGHGHRRSSCERLQGERRPRHVCDTRASASRP